MKNTINYSGKGILALEIIINMLSNFASKSLSFLIKAEKKVVLFLESWGKAAGQSMRA